MLALRRFVVVALLVAVTAVYAQAPSPSPSPSDALADSERFSLKKRHLVMMSAAAKRLAEVEERLSRREKIDWERITKWLGSIATLDRELSVREALLKVPAGGPFAQRLDAARRLVLSRVERLQPSAPAPLLEKGAFEAPDVPAQSAGADTAGRARTKLRVQPTGSVENLFGATAGLKKQALPAKNGR